MSAAAKILDRLQRVKQLKPGSFAAACPLCKSQNGRPVSIRETDDGRILIHAFCGCETGDVLAALGLSLADLFDKPLAHHLRPIRGGFSARELLELSAHEATVVAIIASDAQNRPLTPDEAARLAQAAARLGKAQALIHG